MKQAHPPKIDDLSVYKSASYPHHSYYPGPTLCEVYSNQQIASRIWEITFSWNRPVSPGTFVSILPSPAGQFTLRRPLSIADQNIAENTLTVIYRVVGAGTQALTQIQARDKIDVLGALGNGFPIHHTQLQKHYPHFTNMPTNALIIGGGVGIPPLYLLAKKLVESQIKVELHLGLRQRSEVFWEKKFHQLGLVKWATEDGSLGCKGYVSQLQYDNIYPNPTIHSAQNIPKNNTASEELANVFPSQPPKKYATSTLVYACGPAPMLRYVQQTWGHLYPTYLSLEERMACSTGACYACVTPDANNANHQFRVCFDGPVFCTNEVRI